MKLMLPSAFFQEKRENMLLPVILMACVLAETATSKEGLDYWAFSEKLGKHRRTREFDDHLQRILLYLNKIGDFEAHEVPCGNNGYYRTELKSYDARKYIHVMHTVNLDTAYLKKYTAMNSEVSDIRFAIIKYDLNRERNALKHLALMIPSSDGRVLYTEDLTKYFRQVKIALSQKPIANVNDEVNALKNRLSRAESIDFISIGEEINHV